MMGFSRVIGFFNEDRAMSRGVKQAKVKAAADFNPNVVKASAGVLYSVHITNHDTTPHFIKFYDKASAPDPSADAALLKFTLRLGGTTAGDGQSFNWPHGLEFATGISYAITAAIGETDETALVADDVTGVIGYL